MKKQFNITIDLTMSDEQIWKQIEKAKKKMTEKKPWWKRIFCWG